MSTTIQIKRDTAANWAASDRILKNGEIGYDTDNEKFAIGDGSTHWSAQTFFTKGAVGGGAWGTITGTLSDQTDLQTALDTAVKLTGNQTVAGVKTFSSSPVVPTPTLGTQAANKDFVNSQANAVRCLEFDGTKHHNVAGGYLWNRTTAAPAKFFWDAWIYAFDAANGYFISDGYGGSHNLLAGVDITSSRVTFNGVIYSAGNIVWTAKDSFPVNQWHYVAVGGDGAQIVTYINGVPSSTLAFSGTRQTSGDPSEGGLFIGGSDHNNFTGRIMNVRGFEGVFPLSALDTLNTFTPQHFFKSAFPADGSTSPDGSSLLYDFTRDSGYIIPDLSDGMYNGTKCVRHPGIRQVGAEIAAFKYSQIGLQNIADLPQFVDANHVQPTYTGSTTSPPVGALVFDPFERADVTYAWSSVLGLGASPVGGTPTQTQPMGILSGQAFTPTDTAANEARWNAGTPNVDVTIHRGTVVSQPVILLRYTDANNLTTAALNNGGDLRITEITGGTPSDITWAGAFGDTWLTMRVVMNGAAVTVYLDGVSIFTGTATRLTGNGVGFRISRTLDRVSSISVVPA